MWSKHKGSGHGYSKDCMGVGIALLRERVSDEALGVQSISFYGGSLDLSGSLTSSQDMADFGGLHTSPGPGHELASANLPPISARAPYDRDRHPLRTLPFLTITTRSLIHFLTDGFQCSICIRYSGFHLRGISEFIPRWSKAVTAWQTAFAVPGIHARSSTAVGRPLSTSQFSWSYISISHIS